MHYNKAIEQKQAICKANQSLCNMKIKLTPFFCSILLLVSTQSVRSTPNVGSMQRGTVTFPNTYQISVEIADTEALRIVGLMYRKQLQDDQGMLFVHRDQAIRRVWMKNTLIPLDILFLSSDGKILSMLRAVEPCRQDPCPIFDSSYQAQYMLEVNAGFIDIHKIKTGQKLLLDYKPKAQ